MAGITYLKLKYWILRDRTLSHLSLCHSTKSIKAQNEYKTSGTKLNQGEEE